MQQIPVAPSEEVALDLELVAFPTLPEAACSARTKLHPHSEVRSSNNQQRLIHSVLLATTSKTRTRHPRTTHSAAVLAGNNKNRVESLVLIIQRRITQVVVCSVIHQITTNNSHRLAVFLELTLNLQPTQSSVHPSPQHQALHFSAAPLLRTTLVVIFSEASVPIITSRVRIILRPDFSGLPTNNNRSLGGCSATLEQRLVVACLVAPTIVLSNNREVLCLGIWGPTISNSNPRVSSATPIMHLLDSSEAHNRSKTYYKLLKR